MTPKEAPFGTPMEELRFLQKLETVGNAFWLRFEYIAKAITSYEELKRELESAKNEIEQLQDAYTSCFKDLKNMTDYVIELKRDVKRFIEILNISDDSRLWDEHNRLVKKLSKVGKGE